jgi:hypothetical protein
MLLVLLPVPKYILPELKLTPGLEDETYVMLVVLLPLFKCNLPSLIKTPLPELLPVIFSLLYVYCIDPDWEFP